MRADALARAALALALACAATWASACGYCIEDRVAAVYDHEVVEGAIAKQRHVAFLSIEGGAANEATRRAVVSALEATGALKRTARVALPQAACSVAFDPARTSLDGLVARANRTLAAKHITLAAVRVIDGGGKLREP